VADPLAGGAHHVRLATAAMWHPAIALDIRAALADRRKICS
jgi:hypothetical protein